MPNFQSNEFGWKDVEIAIQGRVVSAALGIKFSEAIERELIYGKGNQPIGVQDGNVKPEGEIKFHQSELERLIQQGGNRGVSGLRDLTITMSMVKDGRISTRTLIGCAISDIGEEYNQNDKFAEITVPFVFLEIIY